MEKLSNLSGSARFALFIVAVAAVWVVFWLLHNYVPSEETYAVRHQPDDREATVPSREKELPVHLTGDLLQCIEDGSPRNCGRSKNMVEPTTKWLEQLNCFKVELNGEASEFCSMSADRCESDLAFSMKKLPEADYIECYELRSRATAPRSPGGEPRVEWTTDILRCGGDESLKSCGRSKNLGDQLLPRVDRLACFKVEAGEERGEFCSTSIDRCETHRADAKSVLPWVNYSDCYILRHRD